MNVEERNDERKRKRRIRWGYGVALMIIAALTVWGIYERNYAEDIRQELDDQYNRAFFDMVGYIKNVETLLAKSTISASADKTAMTLQEAWRQANLAQTNLGQLPVTQPVLANTSKFLTQVGDLSLTLDNQNIRGTKITDKQYETVRRMYKYSVSLNDSLNKLQGDIVSGQIKWGELADKGTKLFSKTTTSEAMGKIQDLDTTFQDYPTLIYDGPFSDHMSTMEARGLTGEDVTIEQARENVKDFLGADRVQNIIDAGKSDGGPINTYSFNVAMKNDSKDILVNIGVSQKGGHIVWMLYNRAVGEVSINMDEAKQAGAAFLKQKGFENMKDTYFMTQGNVATISYACYEDNVVIYPDLIKLKVALDTGDVVGMEAKNYWTNHVKRSIVEPKITLEDARSKINKNLQVSSSGMAIIPTNYKKELYCYEFKGKLDGNDYLVYINAETGNEEDILMIINTPDGVLTM